MGILTAWHLVQKGHKVVILEKNCVATGDSGATTGFLTRVPDTSIADLQSKYGNEFVTKLFQAAAQSQKELFRLLEEHHIEGDFTAVDTYYSAYTENDNVLHTEWEAIHAAVPDAELVKKTDTVQAPFEEAVRFPNEGQWDIRKSLFNIVEKIPKHSLQIFEESEVVDVDLSGEPKVYTEKGSVQAKKIVVATGRPIEYFAETHHVVEPILSYVIAARFEQTPLSNGLFWDTADPYFYYRMMDEHTMIVGGCDLAVDTLNKQEDPYKRLEEFVRTRFPEHPFTMTHQWSGTLFHTTDGLPYAFEHPHAKGKVYIGTGVGGNGLVFGHLIAQTLVDSIEGATTDRINLFSLERTKETIVASERRKQAAQSSEFIPFAPVKELEEGRPVCKEINGKQIVVFKFQDKYSAMSNQCSHAGGSLCDGTIEETTVTCPLHGAQFDIRTGAVLSPPATRPQTTYIVRVQGDILEIQPIPAPPAAASKKSPRPAVPPKKYWRSLCIFAFFAVLFWIAEFCYQYYGYTQELYGSLIRSFGFSGATLLGAALFSSVIFKWYPKTAKQWRLRRYLGVGGFVFIALHFWVVFQYYFAFDLSIMYFSFNPFTNPIVFGSIAFPILLVMAVTSTDGAMRALTPKVWKIIHRFVYIAYWASIFHFLLINPLLLESVPGYLLLGVTALALIGELYWTIRMSAKKHFRSLGTVVGFVIISAYILAAIKALPTVFKLLF